MFVSKINNGMNNNYPMFKGYQHEINSVGERVLRFNYPFDTDTQEAYVEFYRVKKDPKAYSGYVVDTNSKLADPIKLEKDGTVVNLQNITDLDKEEAFAYRIVVDGTPREDSGLKLNGYNLVTRMGTTPMVQGSAILTMPDIHRPGAYYDKDGNIIYDKEKQKSSEGITKTFSNTSGGGLAGIEYDIPLMKKWGIKSVFSTPIQGGDNRSGHHYWNKNNFQLSDDLGSIDNYESFVKKLYQNGMKYVYDATMTSEGLEGIHFQYALRWADKNPQTYRWFRMSGLKDAPLGLGVVPKNTKNLRHRVINPTVIYNESTGKIEKNPNYNPNKETYFQIYDASQVTDEQLANIDKPIDSYQNVKSGNTLDINSHDDTVMNYAFEINPQEYAKRLEVFKEFNKSNSTPIKLNSPEGTMFIGKFANFKIDRKTEGGFVTWDANTDMAKLNYGVSGYDEKINQAITNRAQRDYELKMQRQGAYEVQDMATQSGRYWANVSKTAQILYTAQVLKDTTTENGINKLISDGQLPEEAKLDSQVISNIVNGWYELKPKGILDRDDATVKSLMSLPLDTLEFGENTVGVLSTSYFSNRATTEETVGVSRFDLMKQENPHLVEPYAKNYLKVNDLYNNELKNFADEIITKLNETSKEKLLDENGEYTEYGEYVIEVIGKDIAKYAFLKSLTGDKLNPEIKKDGTVLYDYKAIKDATSLKALGINAHSPEDEAAQLEKIIEHGLKKLNSTDVDFLANAISKKIDGTNVNSFRLAEAMVDRASLGLDIRLDAAKDVIDMDAIRNGDMSFDDAWDQVIDFWKKYVKAVKDENPNAYIVAEITDLQQLMESMYGEKTGVYDNVEIGNKYKSVHDAMIKFVNETGITSEAGYSYTFTDMLKTFSAEFEGGYKSGSEWNRNNDGVLQKLREITGNRGIDYIRNLYTFADNHDKPSVTHGMALDMGLFHAQLFNDGQARREVLQQLTNADSWNEVPLEARLNADNLDYFRTVSSRAAAMSKLMRSCINEDLQGVATDDEIKFMKEALVDLTNGNYLGEGTNYNPVTIKIPALSSFENALESTINGTGLVLSDSEKKAIVDKANSLTDKYSVKGDFFGDSEEARLNQARIELILRGGNEELASGEYDYSQYSPYVTAIMSALREAFIDVKGNDISARKTFLNAQRTFVKKYTQTVVESNREKLPFYEDSSISMKKNGYAARDFKTVSQMIIEQAEYRARKAGKLGENQHFPKSEEMFVKLFRSATEPAIQKAVMYSAYLSAFPGVPTMFLRDILGACGYEEKAKNVYLQNRNAIPWSELEEGPLKEYRNQILDMFLESMNIRNREGASPLNEGTPYVCSTTNEYIPAYLMQDGKGNATVSVFNATGINSDSRFDYHQKLGINNSNAKDFYTTNEIESINPMNKYVPIQKNTEIDNIELAAVGAGIALPVGTIFMNTDARDKTVYEVKRFIKKIEENGSQKEIPTLGIFKKGGGKINLNSKTAKNGVMVLKKMAFRGGNLNKQFNIASNPYSLSQEPEEGKNLSLISR